MPATRATIRKRARIRADQDKSQFPTDAQYDLIIDSCSKTIYGDLVQAGWPVKRSMEIVTLNGSDSYTFLADPIHSVTSVILLSGTTPVCELKRVDESRLVSMLTNTGGVPGYYEVSVDPEVGNVIEIFPSGASGYDVAVRYVPAWPGFVSDDTAWYGPDGSDELIVLMAAAAGCRKEGEVADAQALDVEYQMLWERVISRASWYDQRNVPRIRDVEMRIERDPFDYDI